MLPSEGRGPARGSEEIANTSEVPDDLYDPDDREGTIHRCLPFVKFIAHRIAARLPLSIDLNDLVSAGVLGLMDAIEKYDPSRATMFKTYAEFRIRGKILDELRSLDPVPRSVRQKANLIEGAYGRLEQEFGRQVEDEEVATELGMELDEFYEAISNSRSLSVLSLDEIVDAGGEREGRSLLDKLAGLEEDDPEARIALGELKRILAQAIDLLPERERLVVSLYYHEELTMKEIGQALEVTESRVSQIHSKAILRIKGRLRRLAEERH